MYSERLDIIKKEVDKMNAAREVVHNNDYTIKDIYSLPDGKRAELIDGQIYRMAPPSRKHQSMVHFFDRIIGNYIQEKKGECEIYPAPFAVFLNEDDKNYVEPDISVICDKNKLTEQGCNGAPDWIIEVVSPGSKSMDYYKKLFKYCNSGVKEYWIVDPIKSRVTVYDFRKETTEEYTFTDKVKVGIYEDLEIDLSELKIEK